jgi:hypothetical protein
MKRTNNRSSRNSQPTPQMGTQAAQVVGEEAASTVVALRPAKGERSGLFDTINVQTSQAVANKAQQLSEARQRLAEAADLWNMGETHAKEAEEAAARAGLALYSARTAGTINGEELTAILGDQFGYKAKQDGSKSKTPDGHGEVIRKRLVRAIQAHEFATGTNPNHRFFENFEPSDIEPVLNELQAGKVSIWRFYNRLAEMKKDRANDPVHYTLDPKRIAKMAEDLNRAGIAEAISKSRTLSAAYAGLFQMLQVLNVEAARIQSEAA